MKLIKLLFALITALVLGNVTLTNQSLDQSHEMTNLAIELQALEKEKTILSAEIAAKGSLAVIESKIIQSGFIVPTQILAAGNSASTVASR